MTKTNSVRIGIGSLLSGIVLAIIGAGAWIVRNARQARKTKESWELERRP